MFVFFSHDVADVFTPEAMLRLHFRHSPLCRLAPRHATATLIFSIYIFATRCARVRCCRRFRRRLLLRCLLWFRWLSLRRRCAARRCCRFSLRCLRLPLLPPRLLTTDFDFFFIAEAVTFSMPCCAFRCWLISPLHAATMTLTPLQFVIACRERLQRFSTPPPLPPLRYLMPAAVTDVVFETAFRLRCCCDFVLIAICRHCFFIVTFFAITAVAMFFIPSRRVYYYAAAFSR